ncbi:large ribosomal subunit protein P1 [Procambarus clarkii]|uniref:large ribosomal subunit protein P1 n=1 Tax=Procambarus clarkii TaxID=6728 RepID=UPI001E67681A|nr:60S acidic ribosomal protein P1-like [Procambarus clarkii]
MATNDELACVYAALILMDDDVPITAEKISSILKAANVNVEPYWPGMFAKASSGLDIRSIVGNVGTGVGGGGGGVVAAGGGGAPAAAASAPAAEVKKEEAPESEESDDDMGFSLFG